MAHGLPDWTINAPTETTFVSQDQAELAVRLGYAGTEDRGGEVLWFDDFSNGLGDVTPRELTPATVVYPVLEPSYQRRFVLRSEHGTGKNTACFLEKEFTELKEGKYGLEGGMAHYQNMSLYYYDIQHYSANRKYQYDIRYTHSSGILAYLNSAGGYTNFATIQTLLGAQTRFWVGKLVVDLQAKKYVRFVCKGVVYDLSGIACRDTAEVGTAYTKILIGYTAPGATTCYGYYSHMILTKER